jgi:hypothetical protein
MYAELLWNVLTNLNSLCTYNSVALMREKTILTERPPLVGEISANFCEYRGVVWSARSISTAVFLVF